MNNQQKIRWGILGCGKIANKFAADIKFVNDAELVAVASRDKEKAVQFSKKFKVPRFFDSYESLVADDVDVIYIATPHGLHHQHALLCLKNRKAVLCEKALALNLKQVEEMIECAKQNKVFLMEAFWTKFIPQFVKMMEMVKNGSIGEVKMVHADFGFKAPRPLSQRIDDPKLGGGSLLDIGIYPVFLALTLLGRPDEVTASVVRFPTGVDEQCAMTLKFPGGVLATLQSTFSSDTPVEAVISGTEGSIRMTNRFHSPSAGLQWIRNGQLQPVDFSREEGFGYQYEARHVNECLREELTESPVMKFSDSLLLMETLDRIRAVAGIQYDVDG